MTRKLLNSRSLLFVSIVAALSGCMTGAQRFSAPRADYPVNVERRYEIPIDSAWERMTAFAQQDGMKVVAIDKSSGLLTLVRPVRDGRKLYYNVLLRENSKGMGTVVYVFQRRSQGSAGSAYDAAVLDRLNNAMAQ